MYSCGKRAGSPQQPYGSHPATEQRAAAAAAAHLVYWEQHEAILLHKPRRKRGALLQPGALQRDG